MQLEAGHVYVIETFGLSGSTDTVMAITDHLEGDERLVNWAARFTSEGGTLCLTHVEDEEILQISEKMNLIFQKNRLILKICQILN